MINVLVTAVGSELAFSIIKSLKLIKPRYRIVGCDIFKEVAGKYWCDDFFQVTRAHNETLYIQQLRHIITAEGINVVIPTNDQEIYILSKYASEFIVSMNCHILVNPEEELVRFNDKWLSFLWFKSQNIHCPESWLLENSFEINEDPYKFKYPVVVKPRNGGGSRSIYKVESETDLRNISRIVPGGLVQEYLSPDDEEYTAGTYKSRENEIFVIIFKRTLKFGMTNTARIVFNNDLEHFVKEVIQKTNLIGVNNLQFRLTEDGPKVLEINPRFSGTTGIRANFGFNEAEMWINELVKGVKPSIPIIKNGFVLRFMEEQYHFIE
jgi:carbamoyl-phosphate synthase large subunit